MVKILTMLLAISCLYATAHATDIKLSIEPPIAIANESFRLIFSVDGAVDAEPTFDELDDVVDILGRNRQTSIRWINGKTHKARRGFSTSLHSLRAKQLYRPSDSVTTSASLSLWK